MRHILFVAADIAFGTRLQTWRRRKGFEVDKATSVGAAVKLLVDMKSVDLVLCDLRLPDYDGLRLLAWMHEHLNVQKPTEGSSDRRTCSSSVPLCEQQQHSLQL